MCMRGDTFWIWDVFQNTILSFQMLRNKKTCNIRDRCLSTEQHNWEKGNDDCKITRIKFVHTSSHFQGENENMSKEINSPLIVSQVPKVLDSFWEWNQFQPQSQVTPI